MTSKLSPRVPFGRRDQIIAEVFKPGWRQPTYSVEEAVEFDIENGKILMDSDKKPSKKKEDSDEVRTQHFPLSCAMR